MMEGREYVFQFWIIDKVYLPVQFLGRGRGGDVTFPRNKYTLKKFRTCDVEICIDQV